MKAYLINLRTEVFNKYRTVYTHIQMGSTDNEQFIQSPQVELIPSWQKDPIFATLLFAVFSTLNHRGIRRDMDVENEIFVRAFAKEGHGYR